LLLLALLTACQPAARIVQPADLLPAAAVEAAPPQDMLDALSPGASARFWIRGCTYPKGWLAFVGEVDARASAKGYQRFTQASPGLDAAMTRAGVRHDDYVRDYKSADGKFAVEIVNLNVRRAHGVPEAGSADFVIFGDAV
jgi:hypothetical protein